MNTEASYTTVRVYLSIIVLNSLFGLFAFPLFSAEPDIYLIAWINNLLFGLGALVIALRIREFLPRKKLLIYFVWSEFVLQIFFGVYEIILEHGQSSGSLFVALAISILMGTALWYVICLGIVKNISRLANGFTAHHVTETFLASGLFIINILLITIGFIGLPS